MKSLVAHSAIFLLCLSLLQGCTALDSPSHSNPSVIEQLLLSQAMEKSLYDQEAPVIPLPVDSTVILDTSGLAATHHSLRENLVAWLGNQGLSVQGKVRAGTLPHRAQRTSGGDRIRSFIFLNSARAKYGHSRLIARTQYLQSSTFGRVFSILF